MSGAKWLLGAVFCVSSCASTSASSDLNVSVRGAGTTQSAVGQASDLELVVTNHGGALSNFVIYLSANGDWLAHQVVTDPAGCTINNDLGRLECGPLGAGATKTYSISAAAKDAGNFSYQASFGNVTSDGELQQSNLAFDWTEAVTS